MNKLKYIGIAIGALLAFSLMVTACSQNNGSVETESTSAKESNTESVESTTEKVTSEVETTAINTSVGETKETVESDDEQSSEQSVQAQQPEAEENDSREGLEDFEFKETVENTLVEIPIEEEE